MRVIDSKRAFKPEFVKYAADINQKVFTGISRTLSLSQAKFFSRFEILMIQILNYLVANNGLTEKQLHFIDWNLVKQKVRQFKYSELRALIVIVNYKTNEINFYNLHDEIIMNSIDDEDIDMGHIMKRHDMVFSQFNLDRIFSVKTTSALLSICTRTINDWDKNYRIISCGPKLNSIELLIFRILKYFKISRRLRPLVSEELDWSELISFLLDYDYRTNIDEILFIICLQTKSAKVFPNYFECWSYNSTAVKKTLKYFIEEHINALSSLGEHKTKNSRNDESSITYISLVK